MNAVRESCQTSSTNEIESQNVYVFPNPSNSTIEVTGIQSNELIYIYNAMGQLKNIFSTSMIDV